MTSQSHKPARSVSVSGDNVRAIRERIRAAEARIEVALGYVMFPEVREALRKAHFDLEVALAIAQG
jgi:hypothetical protein